MQTDITILIVDHEERWAKSLKNSLNELGFRVTGIATNFEEAVIALNTLNYDIALLDIDLNNKNIGGIELGRMMYKFYKKPYIFITAGFEKDALDEAIQSRPAAYLTKPLDMASLIVAIQSAIQNFHAVDAPMQPENHGSETFFVKIGDKYKKVSWKNVVYLTSDKNYTVLFNAADDMEYYIRSSLHKTSQNIIPKHLQNNFIQINRAEIVQLPFIDEFKGDEVYTPYKRFTVNDSYIKTLKIALI